MNGANNNTESIKINVDNHENFDYKNVQMSQRQKEIQNDSTELENSKK